jgi:hypothetical protein
MYPDDFIKTWYLIPEQNLPYEEQREIFSYMVFICKFLCSDIGHMDMLIQFDDERRLVEAKRLLTSSNTKFQDRW